MNISTCPLEKRIKYVALLAFVLTAVFSAGHHQSDEHYQILEFAQYQLGKTTASELPWEFDEQMRPSLHPWLAYVAISVLQLFHITDPFAIALLFRLTSAVLLWWVIGKLNAAVCRVYFPEQRWAQHFIFCSFLMWYTPYISVRFSSENLSAAFLLLGLYYSFRPIKTNRVMLVMGLCFGLSVLFRYQLGIAVAGLFMWLLLIDKTKPAQLGILVLAAVAVVAAGTYLDYLFYDEWVFAPFNYLKLNLIDGKAATFGRDPWWYYLAYAALLLLPPFGLVLLGGFFSSLLRLPKSRFSWCIIPFLTIHILIEHKEMRFLFPVNYPFLVLAVSGIRHYFKRWEFREYPRVFGIFVGINLLLLVPMIFRPANEKIAYYQYLYRNPSAGSRTILSTDRDYYELQSGLLTTFYSPQPYFFDTVASAAELSAYLQAARIDSCFYIHRDYEITGAIPGYKLEKVYCIYPDWLAEIKGINWNKSLETESIYLVKKEED